MAVASVPDVGSSLQKLGITGVSLLAFVPGLHEREGIPTLKEVQEVTNELVLDLYRFLNKHPECTFVTLAQWLTCMLGEKWPSKSPPTVKSIRLSAVRLMAKFDKLQKLRKSSEKIRKVSAFLNEEYSLPRVFMAKGELKFTQHLQHDNTTSTFEKETLKAVNVDLCKELEKLKVENESLKSSKENAITLHEKMYAIQRNATKKVKRRDRTIIQQAKDIEMRKKETETLHKKVSQLEPQILQLKQHKDKLRHRADYWRAQVQQLKMSFEEREIQEIVDKEKTIEALRGEICHLEEDNVELREAVEDIMSSNLNEEIATFHKGRYIDDIRVCCYELLSLNVGVRNIIPVIRSVISNLAHKSLDRMPSKALLCQMMVECLTVAHAQLGEELSHEKRDFNTLQTDGTTKYGEHYTTYDVATVAGTYTLGLRHVFSGSAEDSLSTFKEILEDIDTVQKELGTSCTSSVILSKLKNTMSDRHAAEKLFNELLSEYRADILPDVVDGWLVMSDSEREHFTRMNNFFCGLHFLVALADSAEATLKVWESTYESDLCVCANTCNSSSSGTQRLIRTACKAFHARGSQQAGCSTYFRAYLRSKGIDKIPLAAFRGNRFNILFYDAAGVYYLRKNMIDYLTEAHGSLNLLLQAVLKDLKVAQYAAGCRALGIIDKVVTGPLWRYLVLSSVSVLGMSDIYTKIVEKLEAWGEDAQEVMEGNDTLEVFRDDKERDEIHRMLITSTMDDSMVQELLQMLFKSFVLTMQRLLVDHLPGGIHHSVSDSTIVKETESVPTTNVVPERDFAVLDRMLSEKPNATCIALESLLLFSHNKTSGWLRSKSTEERERLLKAARTLASVHKANFRKRREEIIAKRRASVQQKELEIRRKKEKEIREKENLTKQIQKVSLWTTEIEVEAGLAKLRTAKQKCDALKLQLKFRKKVLCQTHPDKTVFMFSHQKKAYTLAELKSNVLKLLCAPETQQPLSAEELAHDPELLIYRRIEHQFHTEDGLEWFRGTVLGYCNESAEYRVVYDDEEEEYSYPLLQDMANGEVRVVEH